MPRRCRWAAYLLAIAGLVAAGPLHAHLLNMSRAQVALLPGGGLEVRLALDLLVSAGSRERYFALSQRPMPLADPEVRELLAPLPEAVVVTLGGRRLPLEVTAIAFPREGREVFLDPLAWPRTDIVLRGDLAGLDAAPGNTGLQVRYTAAFRFEEPIANTVIVEASGRSQTRWLVTEQLSPVFDAGDWYAGVAARPAPAATDWRGIVDFGLAGFAHILPGGIDHLLFVAGLCLAARSLRGLVGVITLFTVAHSLSLAAMTLGWLALPSRLIEPVILISIAWVAVTNLGQADRRRARPVIVVLFGLVHGLGFAGALRAIGLPKEQEIASLVAFNLGVEAGQVAFILLLMTAILLAARLPGDASWPRTGAAQLPLPPPVRRGGSLAILLATGLLLLRYVLP